MAGLIVKDINQNGSSSPHELIDIEGILYFIADSGAANADSPPSNENDNDGNDDDESASEDSQQTNSSSGIGLWKSDGNEGGTRLIRSFDGVSNLTEANGKLYFIAQTGNEYEIWSSDGTTAGTTRVDNLYPGSDDFAAYNLFAVNDTLFFSSKGPEGSSNGYELWRWEGDDVGTKLFKNLFPDRYITNQTIEVDDETGERTLTIETAEFSTNNPEFSTDSFPGNFTSAGAGNFFFTAYSTQTVEAVIDGFADTIQLGGIELWFSDGTENGTYPIPINKESYRIYDPTDGSFSPPSLYDEYYTATGSSFPKSLTAFKNKLYFTANDGLNGFELWSINNQGIGEEIVKDIHPEGSSTPEDLTVVGNRLYFTADDGNGRQLWVVNDNNKVQKIDNSGTDPRHLTEIDGKLYYSARSSQGREPWVIKNGRSAQQLQDINPGNRSSNPQYFQLIESETRQGNQKFLYFAANGGERGIELWSQNLSKSKSSAKRFADIYSGPPSSDPRQLINAGQQLFFTANDGRSGRELWTIGPSIEGPSGSVGAKQSTVKVPENETFVYTFSSTIDDPDSATWSINGGVDSNRFTIDKATGTLNFKSAPDFEQPKDFTRDNNYEVVIRVKDNELGLRSDQFITVTVQDVPEIQGPDGEIGVDTTTIKVYENQKFVYTFSSDASDPESVTWGISGGIDSDLFTINPTTGTLSFKSAPSHENPKDFTQDNNYQLTISVTETSSGLASEQEVTVVVLDLTTPGPCTGNDPETCNPRPPLIQKSSLVKNIRQGTQSSDPEELHNHRGQLFFSANNGRNGQEPWVSQGSTESTTLFLDINNGKRSSSPSSFTSYKSSLYFAADNGRRGSELWASNGQKGGTELVADIQPGEGSSSPSDLVVQGKTLYMAADDGLRGRELWSYDTKSGTSALVRDIRSGSRIGSNPSDLTSLNGVIIFAAEGDAYGRELWSSDGTKNGTKLLKDINPGGLDSDPKHFSPLEGDLYFIGNSYLYGRQIHKLDGSGFNVTEVRGSLGDSKASEPSDLHASRDQLFFSADTAVEPTPDQTQATPSNGESTDSDSDPGGFMVAADGISADAVGYINDYNNQITEFRNSNDPSYIQIARSYANLLLEFENDSSLAADWNQYFQPLTDNAPLQIPADTPAEAASRSTTNSPGDSTANPVEEDSTIYLGRELWISNGKANGNTLLKDIYPGAGSSDPKGFHTVGTKTYFSADNGLSGEELWVSDGTEDGTYMLSDINPGTKDSSPRSITDVDGVIYFSAKSDQHGRELWRLGQPDAFQKQTQKTDKQSSRDLDLDLTRLIYSTRGKGRLRGKRNTADEFIFSRNNQFGAKKADQIIGFSRADGDRIQLESDIFGGIKKRRFKTTTSLQQFNRELERNSNIIYFEPTGELYFDQNGREPGLGSPKDSGLFAVLKGIPELNRADIGLT